MNQVIIYPRGQLKPADRETLKDAGIVAVEADTPHQVVTVIPGAPMVTPDDLIMALLAGVTAPNYKNGESVALATLEQRLLAREKNCDA